MDSMTVNIKYKEFEKELDTTSLITRGDIIEKILCTCNISIYDVEEINIIEKNGNVLTIDNMHSELDRTNIDYLDVIPRNLSNKDNKFIAMYNNYIICREDERIAINLQQEYDLQQNLLSSSDGSDSDSEGSQNNNIGSSELLLSMLQLLSSYNQNLQQSPTNQNPISFFGSMPNIHQGMTSNAQQRPHFGSNIQPTEQNSFSSFFGNTQQRPHFGSNIQPTEQNSFSSFFGNTQQRPHFGSNHRPNAQQRPHFEATFNIQPMDQNPFSSIFETRSNTNSASVSAFISNLLNRQMNDVKIVCSKDDVEKMSVQKYVDLKNCAIHKSDQCNICLEYYADDDDILLLECDHYYHQNCIKQWLLESSNKCPICRVETSKGCPLDS
jgi:hypothetical protein